MVEFISCMLLFSLFLLCFYYERKEKKRDEHEQHLYFCQKRLHKMALRFRDDCMAATKQVVAQYTIILTWKSYRHGPTYTVYTFLSDYQKTIDKLESEYLENYAIKYSEGDNGLRCEAEDLPNYILDEYREELSEIAKTFRDFEYLMWDQIHELKNRQNERS